MGKKKGRPKIPTALKIAQGTHRKDRDGDPAKEVSGTLLKRDSKPPVKLNQYEKAIWKRVLNWLVAKGLATDLDSHAIVAYSRDYRLADRLRA